ncbi:serine/threonine protein kinase, partial [bacterium]|nr:serine/threonine protein kinase [bacterium]
MIGTTLSHYSIESELGRGGMGIVYRAKDTKLDRTVAIKVLPSAALASADDRERFYREAKSAAQLHHPNIASVFEIDEAVPSDAPHGTQPSPFIAMEYIAGGTLQDKIKEKPLSLSDAVKMASQVAEALKAAHAKNIVHRDIKSANVMITDEGVAKVLDFGLAKTNQSTMLTRMGSTLGTVAYMSPEQARGQEVDGRTDLYSLGTMLYEMVAGRLPFAGEYEQAVVYGILNEPPEPLTSLRTGVPMDLERIVNKLMAKDADYRLQTATDLLVDLKSVDLGGSEFSRKSMPAASAASM